MTITINFDDGYGSMGGTLLTTQYSPQITPSAAQFYLINAIYQTAPTSLAMLPGTFSLTFNFNFSAVSLWYYVGAGLTVTAYNSSNEIVGSNTSFALNSWHQMTITNNQNGNVGVRLQFSSGQVIYVDTFAFTESAQPTSDQVESGTALDATMAMLGGAAAIIESASANDSIMAVRMLAPLPLSPTPIVARGAALGVKPILPYEYVIHVKIAIDGGVIE